MGVCNDKSLREDKCEELSCKQIRAEGSKPVGKIFLFYMKYLILILTSTSEVFIVQMKIKTMVTWLSKIGINRANIKSVRHYWYKKIDVKPID